VTRAEFHAECAARAAEIEAAEGHPEAQLALLRSRSAWMDRVGAQLAEETAHYQAIAARNVLGGDSEPQA